MYLLLIGETPGLLVTEGWVLMKPSAIITLGRPFIIWSRKLKSFPISMIAEEYSSSTSSCDKNTDRGDGQVTRNFVIASKDNFERRPKNICTLIIGL